MIELKWRRIEYAEPVPKNAVKVPDLDEPNTPYQWAVLQYRQKEPKPTPVNTPEHQLIAGYIWGWGDWQDVEISDE